MSEKDPFADPEFRSWYEQMVADDWKRLEFAHATPPDPAIVDKLLKARVHIEGITSWRPANAECWFCKPNKVPAIADSLVRGKGQWAHMCLEHYLEKGTAPGKGSSQVLIDGLKTQPNPPDGEA